MNAAHVSPKFWILFSSHAQPVELSCLILIVSVCINLSKYRVEIPNLIPIVKDKDVDCIRNCFREHVA